MGLALSVVEAYFKKHNNIQIVARTPQHCGKEARYLSVQATFNGA